MPATDVQVAEPRREFGAQLGRYLLWGLLGLILVAGVWSVFVRPFLPDKAGDDAGAASASAGHADAASAAAERFALDYLTWAPSSTATRSAALSADSQQGADVGAMGLSGSMMVSASTAIAGQVHLEGDASAVVPVDVLVRVAKPESAAAAQAEAEKGKVAAEQAADDGGADRSVLPGAAAAAIDVPKGYRVQGAVWLRLAVPVVSESGRWVAAGTGPVLLGDPLPQDRPEGGESDTQETQATTEWAADFLAAYASSAAEYQAAPGVTLAGLAGAVSVKDVQEWSLSVADEQGRRDGRVRVTWQLAGTDVTVTQGYSLVVTEDAGRWYVQSLGPATPAP